MASYPGEDDRPFVFRVEPFAWDDQEVWAYEAAIDALHDIIGRFSSVIWKEEHQSQPNRERLNHLRRRKNHYVEIGESLRLVDQEKIAEVRRVCAHLRANPESADGLPG